MSKDNKSHGSGIDRRSVLKAVGVSAAAGLSMSGSATAREFPEAEVERVRAAYDDDLLSLIHI